MTKKTQQTFNQRFASWRAVVFFAILQLTLSCNDDNILGLEVQPEGSLSPVQFIDTFSIIGKSIPSDPQRSSQYRAYLGKLQNETAGSSEAMLFLNFQLESENVTLDEPATNYVIDRIFFRIYPREVYGNGDIPLPVELYLLDEALSADSIYTGSRRFRTDDRPASRTEIQLSDNEEIAELLADSAYQGVVWELDPSIGGFLLNGLGTVYTNTPQFRAYFNGIALKVASDADLSGGGAIYDFAIATGETGIFMEYHSKSDPETKLEVSFPMTASTSRVNGYEHDAGNSLLGSMLSVNSKNHETLFVQGLSGVKTFIEIPYLDEFGAQNDIAIHRATITFPLSSSQPAYLSPAPLLYLLDFEIDPSTGDTIETLNADFVFSSNRHGGLLNNEENSYTFDITRQVQKILEAAQTGENQNLGFTLNAQVPVLNQNNSFQSVLDGSDNIVFKVYFTDISK